MRPEDIDVDSHDGTASHLASAVDLSAFTEDSELKFGYCTELLLRLQRKKTDLDSFDAATVTEFLKTVGDSIVCFKQGTIVKIHVHTKTPERVLEFCRRYGEFLTVKIENMSLQHNESLTEEGVKAKKKKRVKFATVAVASGDGIEKVFSELGADCIIKGGQTMNPSAEDFLKAFDEVNADNIFVLPNNGNIILSARQAAGIYEKSNVFVVESHSLGDGYAALSALNYEVGDTGQIAEYLTDAMKNVVTCMVTVAVRDTNLNSVEIHTGDYIGFSGKTMLASEADCLAACKSTLSRIGLDEKFALTVFVGSDVTEEESAALESYINETYPDVEVYMIDGGQGVYNYIFVAE